MKRDGGFSRQLATIAVVYFLCSNVRIQAATEYVMPDLYYDLPGSVVTPHIPWARPYAGKKPIRVLVLAPRWTQRETVELMQRLDMNCTPFFLYSDKEVHLVGGNWGLETVKRVKKEIVLADFKKAVADSYDVIIVGRAPTDRFPPEITKALVDKIRAGTGVLYVSFGKHPNTDFEKTLTENKMAPGADTRFVTVGIPFEKLVGLGVSTNTMKDDLSRLLSFSKCGKGRVVFINYSERGKINEHFLTPADQNDLHYEYYQSFIIKAVLWAAGREPEVLFNQFPAETEGKALTFDLVTSGEALPEDISLALSIRSARLLYTIPESPIARPGVHQTKALVTPVWTGKKEIGSLTNASTDIRFPLPELPEGEYFVDVEVLSRDKKLTWATSLFRVKTACTISEITIDPDVVDCATHTQHQVNVTVLLDEPLPKTASLRIAMIDNYDRILGQKELPLEEGTDQSETVMTLSTTDMLTSLVNVRAELSIAGQPTSIRTAHLTTIHRPFPEFTFLCWSPGTRGYVSRQRYRMAAHLGVDACRTPGSFHSLRTADLRFIPDYTRLFGVVDKESNVNKPCLSDPAYRRSLYEKIERSINNGLQFDVFAHLLGDEFAFANGDLPGACNSRSCISSFRKYLHDQYETIDHLNDQWGRSYASFSDIVPITDRQQEVLAEAEESGNYSPLIDNWLFNYLVFTDTIRFCARAQKELDPLSRLGVTTPLWNMYYRAYDWASIMPHVDFFSPYFGKVRGEISHTEGGRCFAQPGTSMGVHFGSYITTLYRGRYYNVVPHDTLLQGFRHVFWYQMYAATEGGISPSLEPYPQLAQSVREIERIKNGLARLILGSERAHDGIAVLYSMPSHLFSFLASGPPVAWELNALLHSLQDLGFQCDLVTPAHLEDTLKNCKALFLTTSQCIGDTDAQVIKTFVENGGILIADIRPGIADEHGKVRDRGVLSDVFGLSWKTPLRKLEEKEFQPTDESKETIEFRFEGEYKGRQFSSPLQKKITVDGALSLNGADCVLKVDGIPLLTHNAYGNGAAICKNAMASRGLHNALAAILSAHGIEPLIKTRSELTNSIPANYIPGLEFCRFTDGNASYYGITKVESREEKDRYSVIIDLQRGGHLYDILENMYLGYKESVSDDMGAWHARWFSHLPYHVEDIRVRLEKNTVDRGKRIRATAEIVAATETPSRHVINVRAIRPDGTTVSYLTENFETQNGKAQISIPTALNDPAGVWTLKLVDTATGVSKTVDVSVSGIN